MDEPFDLPPWEAVRERLRQAAPDAREDQLRDYYEGQRHLAAARATQAQRTSEPIGQYLDRRAIPFVSSLQNFSDEREYGAARQRLAQGFHQPGDAERVAHHERTKQIDEERGIGGQIGSALAHAPAIVGEFAAGGAALGRLGQVAEGAGLATRAGAHLLRSAAITPFVPSSYLPQMAEDNQRAGRDVTDLRGLPAAVAVGAVNNAILGTLQGVGNAGVLARIPGPEVGRFVARQFARAGAGVVEQGIADVLTGISGLSTGTGTFGDVAAGRFGDAAKHALVQAVTFAAFGALHEAQHRTPRGPMGERPEAVRKATEEAAKVIEDTKTLVESGMPLDKATETVKSHWEHEHQAAQGPRPGEEAMPESQVNTPNHLTEAESQPSLTQPESRPEAPPGAQESTSERNVTNAAPEAQTGQKQGVDTAPMIEAPAAPAPPAPEPAAAVEQRTPKDKLEKLAERASGGDLIDFREIDGVLGEAGISPRDRNIVESWLHEGKSLRDVAEPLGISHERVRQILAKASEAMGQPRGFLMDLMVEREATKPQRVMAEEFQGTPEFRRETAKIAQRKIAEVDKSPEFVLEKKLKKLANNMMREGDKNGGDLPPERREWYERESARLRQAYRGGAQPEAPETSRTPPKAVEPAGETSRPEAGQEPAAGQPPNNRGPGSESSAASGEGARPEGVAAQQFDRAVARFEKENQPIKQIGGGSTTVPDPSLRERAIKKAVAIVHGVRDEVDRFSGKMFPATTRVLRELGESASRWVNAHAAAQMETPVMIENVFGADTKAETAQHWMDVFHEERARHAKEFNLAEAERHRKRGIDLINQGKGGTPEALEANSNHAYRKDMANAVHSFLGDNYSIPNEAAYQKTLASAEYQAFKSRWREFMTPEMEKNYRGAQGMDEHDHISSPTQLPEHPFNAIAERTPAASMNALGGRGNLNNVKLKNNPFANEATLAAEKYNTNYGDIIARSLAIGATTARKAEFIRLGVEKGEMDFAKPGQVDLKTPLGQPTVEFKNVKPPKGTQDAGLGETSLYVNEAIAKEFRQALQVDEPLHYPILNAFNHRLTQVTLASSAEMVYHAKNLLTSLFKPGVNPVEVLFTNPYKLLTNDVAARQKLVELAKIGASRQTEHGMESGSLWGGKTDPTTWGAKVLHLVSDSVRLGAVRAHERLVNRGSAQNTETSLRDFANQMTGQYNKAAQSKLIMWLRDLGLSPFATASSKFYMSGLQTLIGSHGAVPTSLGHDIAMRAEVFARIGTVLGAVALVNYLKWGSVLGDDNTPFGAIKTGETGDGKTSYFDLTALTGLTRGMRSTGLLALGEGVRKDQSPGRMLDNASSQMIASMMHAFEGPAVSFVYTMATGKNTLGQQITQHPSPSGSHFLENLKAAAGKANPAIGTLAGFEEPRQVPLTTGERVMRLGGPFTEHYKGGAAVSELHQHLQDLTDARTLATRQGQRFDNEWQYRRLHLFSQRIAQLEHLASGDVRAARRWFGQPSAERDEGRVREIRAEQARLARLGLEAIR